MSDPTPAKKRRLNAAATLSKPFRSPMRSTPTTSTSTPAKPLPIPTTTTTPVPKSLLNPTATPVPTATDLSDPLIASASALLTDLTTQIQLLKSQVEKLHSASSSLSQAPQIAASQIHWRGVAQTAADTLFPYVAANVAGAGGMKAFDSNKSSGQGWKEEEDMSWEKEEARMEAAAEETVDGEGNTVGEAEREGRREEVRLVRERKTKAEEGEDGEKEEVGKEFTMEVMLRKLHIEEGVIGWDRGEQRWVP